MVILFCCFAQNYAFPKSHILVWQFMVNATAASVRYHTSY